MSNQSHDKLLLDFKKQLILDLDLSNIQEDVFNIIKQAKENVHYYWADYSDIESCSFCCEDDKHDKQCLSLVFNNAVKHKDNFPSKKLNKLCIEIAEGSFYSTCCNHVHIDCCSYCGEYSNKHNDDCAHQQMIVVLGDIYSDFLQKINDKKNEIIQKENQILNKQKERRNQAFEKNKKKQLEENKIKWRKIAEKENKVICSFCFRPFSNIEDHLKFSKKCKK